MFSVGLIMGWWNEMMRKLDKRWDILPFIYCYRSVSVAAWCDVEIENKHTYNVNKLSNKSYII